MGTVSRTSHSPRRRITGVVSAIAEPARFRLLALFTAVLLWVIVPSGGLVRLTGSGLGCPDWPLCNGGVIPETGYHAIIEYTNRLLSAFIVLTTIVTWLVALRFAGPRRLRRLAMATMLMTIGQVPLGALTVITDLHPLMVGSHFVLSFFALATVVLLVIGVDDHIHGRVRGWDPRRGPFAALAALALFGTIISGVLVTAAGPHSGDDDVLERFGDLEMAAWVHVRFVGVLVVLMVVLAVWLYRERPTDPRAGRAAKVFLALLAIQITIGEVQFRNGLPWQVVLVHVAVSALVWMSGLTLAWRVARPPLATTGTDRAASPADHEPVAVGAERR